MLVLLAVAVGTLSKQFMVPARRSWTTSTGLLRILVLVEMPEILKVFYLIPYVKSLKLGINWCMYEFNFLFEEEQVYYMQ